MGTIKITSNKMVEIDMKKSTEMTRQIALKFYKIAKWIDPYDICDLDKEEHIKGFMRYTFEENLQSLKDYIIDRYDMDYLLDDKEFLRLYLSILKEEK